MVLLQVFVWEDRDEDVVDSYKTLEGHRSDILAMAAYAPRQLLATGDVHRLLGYLPACWKQETASEIQATANVFRNIDFESLNGMRAQC